MESHPELFRNPVGPGVVRIIRDRDSFLRGQAALYRLANSLGKPEVFYDLGVVSEDDWYVVLRDLVEFPNGQPGAYVRFVCKRGGFQNAANVAIVPCFGSRVLISRQFIHRDRTWHWQTPRGFGEPGLSAEDNAAKELMEEIGCVARRFQRIDRGTSDCAVFLAVLPMEVRLPPSLVEFEIDDIEWITLPELRYRILEGTVTDPETMLAFVFLLENGFPS
jgi:ADP-ribose pyrophosphatase